MSRHVRQHHRSGGITIFEMVVTLGLLLAAAGTFAQLHSLAARQQRAAEARAIGAQAVANWMERCSQVPFAQLSEDRLTELADTRDLQSHLPGAEASAKIEDDKDALSSKRVTLVLSWQSSGSPSSEMARLVGWRHGLAVEAEPTP